VRIAWQPKMTQQRVRVDPKKLAADMEVVKAELARLKNEDVLLRLKSDYLTKNLTKFAKSFIKAQHVRLSHQGKVKMWLYVLSGLSLANLLLYFWR